MSVVTGVVLVCDVLDGTGDEDKDGNDLPSELINTLNDWLTSHGFGPMQPVQEQAGGNKHPQLCIYAAGYNHFGSYEDKFAEQFRIADWFHPENAILMLQPEDGPTRVFAPSNRQWCDFIEDICPVCETHLLKPSTT